MLEPELQGVLPEVLGVLGPLEVPEVLSELLGALGLPVVKLQLKIQKGMRVYH